MNESPNYEQVNVEWKYLISFRSIERLGLSNNYLNLFVNKERYFGSKISQHIRLTILKSEWSRVKSKSSFHAFCSLARGIITFFGLKLIFPAMLLSIIKSAFRQYHNALFEYELIYLLCKNSIYKYINQVISAKPSDQWRRYEQYTLAHRSHY
jgi:hypothetical protein